MPYRNEILRQAGNRHYFWNFVPVITLAAILTASNEVPFAVRELTAEYQEVTVQGPYGTSPGYSSCYSPGRLQHDRHHGNGCSRMSEHSGHTIAVKCPKHLIRW
ncbi:MAG: hypothetical protein AAES65_13120 [Candidatus Thiodiazotropha sp. (ex. Lucinoma kazani)]